ncbi:hypothetical protein CVT25_009425, partial [Psilocybe cyanescens]
MAINSLICFHTWPAEERRSYIVELLTRSHVYMLIYGAFNQMGLISLFELDICLPKYNKETIHLLETDPRLQIVISTVAFSNGLNAKSLLDSLSLGFGATFNESWQEKGR